MEAGSYFAKTIKIKNPFIPYGLAKIIISAIAVILSALTLIKIQELLRSIIKYQRYQGNEFFLTGIILVGIISISWFIWGLNGFFTGIRSLVRLIVPPNVPPDFEDFGEIEETLIKRELKVYRVPLSGLLSIVRKFISSKTEYMTQVPRNIAEQNISYIKKILTFLIMLGLFFFLTGLIPQEALNEIGITNLNIPFPNLFIVILAAIGAIKILSIYLILPTATPRTDVLEWIHSIRGGGDPFVLISDIEKALLVLRYQGIPNRVNKFGLQEEEGKIKDSGKFSGKMFVETQPSQISYSKLPFTLINLTIGSCCLFLGLIILTGIPYQLQNVNTPNYVNILSYLWLLVQGLTYTIIGKRFYSQSFDFLSAFRYESILAFINVEGVIGRTEIRAGKAMTDSFESSNVVIRSDSNVRIFTAKILSENFTPSGKRSILGMISDPETESAQNIIENSILEHQKVGVAVRGIDISDEGIHNIAKANITYHQMKKIGTADFTNLKLTNSKINGENKILAVGKTEDFPKSDLSSAYEEETKICPDCAETVKKAARKCRYCGYIFEEQ